ncbi:hypothetical protein ACFL3E_00510 [Patescibacteria group bacterium]
MRQIIKYLLFYNDDKKKRSYYTNIPLENWYKKEVNRHKFIEYLIFQKHYLENWRETLNKWLYPLTKTTSFFGAKSSLYRAHKQRDNIDHIINYCIARKYIKSASNLPRPTPMETNLSVEILGKEFIKPLRFIDAVLKEYGYSIAFFFGLISSGTIYGIIKLYKFFF